MSFLWINFAVAVVLLIPIAGHQISSFQEFLRALVYVLMYTNLACAFGAFLIGRLVERPGRVLRKFPLVPVVAMGFLFFSAVGCLLAQTLLMVTGFLVSKALLAGILLHSARRRTPGFGVRLGCSG